METVSGTLGPAHDPLCLAACSPLSEPCLSISAHGRDADSEVLTLIVPWSDCSCVGRPLQWPFHRRRTHWLLEMGSVGPGLWELNPKSCLFSTQKYQMGFQSIAGGQMCSLVDCSWDLLLFQDRMCTLRESFLDSDPWKTNTPQYEAMAKGRVVCGLCLY